jgi:hypothetical protein
MKVPALLIALLLSGCGSGVSGVPVPPPIDVLRIVRPKKVNTALAAPAGFRPVPDITTHIYGVPVKVLYAAIYAVALGEKRTFLLKAYDRQMQADFVARSAVFGLPDVIMVQAMPNGPDSSSLIIWSWSVYHTYDFGANRERVIAWLDVLNSKLGRAS